MIAGFLRDSTVRRILALSFIEFFTPEYAWEELDRHLPMLGRRGGLSVSSAQELRGLLRRYVTTIPREALLPVWRRAQEAIGHVDPKDVAYLAAALAVPCDGIWSDDRHLKAQESVPCWTTKELVAALRTDGFRA